jgi:LysR family transcriptional activator of nhaA
LALDVVLTNLAPARDAASQWLVHRIDEQPVSLIGTPGRLGAERLGLRELLATQPLIAPTRETGLRAAFDALAARLEVTPILAAEVDDMAMIRLLARADAGLAIIPPIVVRDELQSGALVEAARLDGISETFFAVTQERRFPNPLLAEVLHR